MAVRELDEAEYKSTCVSPMRRLAVGDEPPVWLDLEPYVAEVIGSRRISVALGDLATHHVYVTHRDRHTHVLFSFGLPNTFLVIVIDNAAKSIFGFHVLDLGALYGVE